MPMGLDFRVGEKQRSWKPHFALVFHHGDGTVVTRHAIRSYQQANTTVPRLAPGSLVSTQSLEDVLGLLLDKPHRRELLPPNVLLSTSNETLWYQPRQQRKMWFATGTRKKVLNVAWPALVFHARNNGLRIAAIAANTRPKASTRLYHAPLMNVYASGELCLGNIAPSPCDVSGIPGWEAAVYDTLFVHTNHDQTLKHPTPPKNDNAAHYRFWKHLNDTQTRRFPRAALVPRNETLGDWINA